MADENTVKQRLAEAVTAIRTDRDKFLDFAGVAGQLYTQPLYNQVMIADAMVDATMVATADRWMKEGFTVRQGAKSIPVIDRDSPNGLSHIYDVSQLTDEGDIQAFKDKNYWTAEGQSFAEAAMSRLEGKYGYSSTAGIVERIKTYADMALMEIPDHDYLTVEKAVENEMPPESAFMRLKVDDREMAVQSVMASMVTASVCSRLGIPREQYASLIDMDALSAVGNRAFAFVGFHAAEVTKDTLHYIYENYKEIEREAENYERADDYREPDSGDPRVGRVGEEAGRVPAEETPGRLHGTSDDGRADGRPESGTERGEGDVQGVYGAGDGAPEGGTRGDDGRDNGLISVPDTADVLSDAESAGVLDDPHNEFPDIDDFVAKFNKYRDEAIGLRGHLGTSPSPKQMDKAFRIRVQAGQQFSEDPANASFMTAFYQASGFEAVDDVFSRNALYHTAVDFGYTEPVEGEPKKAVEKEKADGKIIDFGEKIGGARKDYYGASYDELKGLSAAEKYKSVTKTKLWKKDDAEKLVADGMPQAVAYFRNEMYKAVASKPTFFAKDNSEELKVARIDAWAKTVCEFRDKVQAVKTEADVKRFFSDNFNGKIRHYYAAAGSRVRYVDEDMAIKKSAVDVAERAMMSYSYMEQLAKENLYGIPDDRKEYTRIVNETRIYEFAEPIMNDADFFQGKYDGKMFIAKESAPQRICMVDGRLRERSIHIYKDEEFAKFKALVPGKMVAYAYDIGKAEYHVFTGDTKEEVAEKIKAYAEEQQEKAIDWGKTQRAEKAAERKEAIAAAPMKERYTTAPVRNIEQSNAGDVLGDRKIAGQDYLDDFKMRGGEFGNWLSDKERQESLNAGYVAFQNIAKALGIKPASVSLGGELAIAFGSRGRGGKGGAAAHYESERNVINLTKIHGAGSLAHEYGHALDSFIGAKYGVENKEMTSFATEATKDTVSKLPEKVQAVKDALRYKTLNKKEYFEQVIRERCGSILAAFDRKTGLQGRSLIMNDPDRMAAFLTEVGDAAKTIDFLKGDEKTPFTVLGKCGNKPTEDLLSAYQKLCGADITYDDYMAKPDREMFNVYMDLLSLKKGLDDIEKEPKTEYRVETDYYKRCRTIQPGKHNPGSNQHYWTQPTEMFARAFSLYVQEKLAKMGIKDTYLVHESPDLATMPHGKDKERIFKAIDDMVLCLKKERLIEPEEGAEMKSETLSEESGVITLSNGDRIFVQESDEGYVDYTIYNPDGHGKYIEDDGGIYEEEYGSVTTQDVVDFAYFGKMEQYEAVSFQPTEDDPYQENQGIKGVEKIGGMAAAAGAGVLAVSGAVAINKGLVISSLMTSGTGTINGEPFSFEWNRITDAVKVAGGSDAAKQAIEKDIDGISNVIREKAVSAPKNARTAGKPLVRKTT